MYGRLILVQFLLSCSNKACFLGVGVPHEFAEVSDRSLRFRFFDLLSVMRVLGAGVDVSTGGDFRALGDFPLMFPIVMNSYLLNK